MPLPNYGFSNEEKKRNQELVFEMAPEVVDDGNEKQGGGRRAKVTTGKLGIDMERKFVIDTEKDKHLWRTEVDPDDVANAKRFADPQRKHLRKDVHSTLDTLISHDKLDDVLWKRKKFTDHEVGLPLSSSEPLSASRSTEVSKRFSSPSTGVRDHFPVSEETRSGVSIQPRGSYKVAYASSNYQSVTTSKVTSKNPRAIF